MNINDDNQSALDLAARKKKTGKTFIRWAIITWAILFIVITYYREILNALSVPSVQDVRLNVEWKQDRWNGYADGIDKPTSEWKDKTLDVHVVVNLDSSSEISDIGPRAFVLQSNNLRLCYYQNRKFNSAGQPIAPGVVTPVLLEFLITGIPKKDYIIEVSAQCPALSAK